MRERQMSLSDNATRYLIMDTDNHPLAHAYLNEEIGDGRKIFTHIDKNPPDLTSFPQVSIISLNAEEFTVWTGSVQEQRRDRFVFQLISRADNTFRRNLRVHLHFSTYLYPERPGAVRPGSSPGPPVAPRIAALTYDISCGGVSLFPARALEKGGIYSLVIPIVRTPLLLPVRVLCTRMGQLGGRTLTRYACEFYDLLPREEALLRETIFEYQLKHPGNP